MRNRFYALALRCMMVLISLITLTGCITTGVRVGPVFIPVDTGIGKEQPPKTEPSSEPEQQEEEDSESSDSDTENQQ